MSEFLSLFSLPFMQRALVAKELARTVFYMLRTQEAFNGTFTGTPLSRTKQPKWPRLASPPAELEPPSREGVHLPGI